MRRASGAVGREIHPHQSSGPVGPELRDPGPYRAILLETTRALDDDRLGWWIVNRYAQLITFNLDADFCPIAYIPCY